MNKILLLILLVSSVSTEILTYNAKFKNIGVGIATLELGNSESYYKKINFSLKTKKFVDVFYKLRENIYMEVDSSDFSLYYINKKSQQGKYFNEYELKIENNAIKKIYDPISIIYFLRNQNLKINDEYVFNIYNSKKDKKISMKVIGEENIAIKSKTYDCFVLAPFNVENSKGQIKLWISKENKIPIIIEQNGKNGKMVLKLKNIKNDS